MIAPGRDSRPAWVGLAGQVLLFDPIDRYDAVIAVLLENRLLAQHMWSSSDRKTKEKDVVKGLGVVLGGIFVGAAGMEVFRRKFPNALDSLYSGVRKTASGVVERFSDAASGARQAFWEGYERATGPQEAAEPSV